MKNYKIFKNKQQQFYQLEITPNTAQKLKKKYTGEAKQKPTKNCTIIAI